MAQRNCDQKVPLIYKISLRCLGPKASTPYCYTELFQLRSSCFQLSLSIHHFCKFKCLISVSHTENEEYTFSDHL